MEELRNLSPPMTAKRMSIRFTIRPGFHVLVLAVLALFPAADSRHLLSDSSNGCRPSEVHLGVTKDPTSMRVTWRTQSPECPTTVEYSLSETLEHGSSFPLYADGVSYAVDPRLFCGSVASSNDLDLHLHSVVMTGLLPDREYIYSLPSGDRSFVFRALKPAGDPSPFVFFAFGDMGVHAEGINKNEGSKVVMSAMLKESEDQSPDLVLHIGDISYANGNPAVWDAFMSSIEPLASRVAWIVGTGNHEYDVGVRVTTDPWGLRPFHPSWGNQDEDDSGGECGLHVYFRFPVGNSLQPAIESRTKTASLSLPSHGKAFPPFYFSFDQGLVHFVFISTEHDIEEGSSQMVWLNSDLSRVDRCLTPFVVVGGHRPFYAPETDVKDVRTGAGLRERLEPVMIENRVDAYISGHVHAYYRLCEAKDGVCMSPGEGLVSIVAGAAGHELDKVRAKDVGFGEISFWRKFGFAKFSVKGREKMELTYVDAETSEALDRHVFYNQGLCALDRAYPVA